MYQNYQYEVDPKDPFKPLYQGTFEETVEVGGKRAGICCMSARTGARPSTGRCVGSAGERQDSG